MNSTCSMLAFAFSLLAYAPYVGAIHARKANPTLSTWISWGIVETIILSSLIVKDEVSWQVVAYVTGTFAIVGMSLYRRTSTFQWTRVDTVCVSVALAALLMWCVSGDPENALICCACASACGSIPFLRDICLQPSREPIVPWMLSATGAGFGVLTISEWSVAGATPVAFFALKSIVVLLISRQFIKTNAA